MSSDFTGDLQAGIVSLTLDGLSQKGSVISLPLKESHMATLLLVIIYIAFISLGLPDGMLGAGWPVMQKRSGRALRLRRHGFHDHLRRNHIVERLLQPRAQALSASAR